MDLSTLLQDVSILKRTGDLSGMVSGICYDSRQCGENSLFVAIAGLVADGHDYIPEAIRRGARVIVHEKPYTPSPGVTALQVSESRRVLGVLGRNFYGNPSARLCLVGVIGTNGKTTVTYLLESIFTAAGWSAGVLGTVNYRFGGKVLASPHTTPESLEMQRILREMADDGVSHVVAEVSSHSLDLRRVDDCSFDLGVFTNLTQDHLDYHGTMDNYFDAKKRFFREILPAGKRSPGRRMVVNGDDPWGRRLLEEAVLPALSYGMDNPCDVRARDVDLSLGGIRACIETAGGRFQVSTPLVGRFNLYNILAAAAAATALRVPEKAIGRGIAALKQIPGRLEKIGGLGDPQVFVDYAHTEDALRRVLQDLSGFKKQGRLLTLFGCGGDRDRGKRPRMGRAAAELSDLLLLTSDNPRTEEPMEIIRQIASGIPSEIMNKVSADEFAGRSPERHYSIIPDRAAAIAKIIACAGPSDMVLIAGKGHEDYQILGNRRIAFDDRVVAASALAGRAQGKIC